MRKRLRQIERQRYEQRDIWIDIQKYRCRDTRQRDKKIKQRWVYRYVDTQIWIHGQKHRQIVTQ